MAATEQVTCDSPCDCHDARGEGRWSVKTDASVRLLGEVLAWESALAWVSDVSNLEALGFELSSLGEENDCEIDLDGNPHGLRIRHRSA